MRQNVRRILIALGAVIVLAVVLFTYDYFRLNLWIDRDVGRLEDYPIHLVSNSKEVKRPPGKYGRIDRLLIDELGRGRNVVNMSRLEIKLNLLRTHAYAKVFLETAAPNEPEVRSSLKLVCEFKRGPNGWELAGPPKETTLE